MRLSFIFFSQVIVITVCLIAIVVTFIWVATNSVNDVVKVAASNELHRLATEINLTIAVVEPTLQAVRRSSEKFQQQFWRYSNDGYPLEYFNSTIGWMADLLGSQPSWMYLYETYQVDPVPIRIQRLDAAAYFWNDSSALSGSGDTRHQPPPPPPTNVKWASAYATNDQLFMIANASQYFISFPDQNALGGINLSNLTAEFADYTNEDDNVINRHMRVGSAAFGFWQGPYLWYNALFDRQEPLATFTLPGSFDATTGYCVHTYCVDVNLQFMADALKSAVRPRTVLFIVDLRDRKLLTTSNQGPNVSVAFNTTTADHWVPWTLPHTPYATLNTAWLEICKVMVGYDCDVPQLTFSIDIPAMKNDPIALQSTIYTTTATDLIAAVRIHRHDTLLNWMAISVTPRDYYLAEFEVASIVLIVVAVVVILLILFVSTMTYVAIVWPLQAMMQQMGKVSSSLGEETDSTDLPAMSVLTELSQIQVRYMELKAHLRKVCSYLPPAIVLSLLSEEEAEVQEIRTHHHNVLEMRSTATGRVSTVGGGLSRRSSTQSHQEVESCSARIDDLTRAPVSKDGGSDQYENYGAAGLSGSPRVDSFCNLKEVMTRVEAQLLFSAKKLSVLMINICGFHQRFPLVPGVPSSGCSGSLSVTRMTESLVAYTRVLSEVADQYRGVMHSLHGDHAVLSFNASLRCVSHAEKAAWAAFDIAQRFSEVQQGETQQTLLTMGLSSGVAMVGQAGTDTMKQLAVIGEVYKTASLLERLNKKYAPEAYSADMRGHRLLMDGLTAESCESALYLRAVGVLPVYAKEVPKKCTLKIISTLHGLFNRSVPKGAKNDCNDSEWMYELQRAQDNDPNKEINAAFRLLCDDACNENVIEAAVMHLSAALRDVSDEQQGVALQYSISTLNQLTRTIVRQKDGLKTNGDSVAADWGSFFERCW